MTTEKIAKIAKIYGCELCYYNTYNKTDFNKHLQTNKHILAINTTNTTTSPQKSQKIYNCNCGKIYLHRASLFNHNKICNYSKHENVNNVNDNENVNYKELFIMLVEQMKEQNEQMKEQGEQMKEQGEQNKLLQSTLIDLIPKINASQTTNSNNHNNNTINQNVNINMFLNENCKDAISMDDFVKSIEITVNDLLYTKNNGLINGMSNIFMENLNRLPLVKRPLWCSDKKRRRIFIKEDKWKEDSNNTKTKTAIKNVGVLQLKNVKNFIKDKPNWIHNECDKDDYMSIVKHATEPMDGNEDKIIDGMIEQIHLTNDKKNEIVN